MASSGQVSFHENDIIIIDPIKTPRHGDYVIALLPRSKQAIFKQYVVDGSMQFLRPLNPQYPLINFEKGTKICGVVVKSLKVF